jgi:hypothetical protein
LTIQIPAERESIIDSKMLVVIFIEAFAALFLPS